MWWLAFFFLLGLGVVLLVVAARWRDSAGVAGGRIVSIDLERDGRPASTMVDESLGLTGRPDLLLETRDGLVPVEIKSGPAPAIPYLSHVLQLAAYARLTEATYSRRPHYGVLKYADLAYSLPYTKPLERQLLLSLGRMRALQGGLPARSHREAARCGACGYAAVCDQRLTGAKALEGGSL